MSKEIRAKLYPNSQYGKRDVIGDTAVINNFDYQALRDYYHKWYGPDNQAIIVVGDIDVDAIEAKIKALWADVPERANRGERPLYTVDFNTQPVVAIATDPEAQQTQIYIEYLREQLPDEIRGTQVEYTLNLVHSLIGSMLSNRFDEMILQPDASIVAMRAYYYHAFKLRDNFQAICVPKEGHETEALHDLLEQVEKLRRYGFTNAELELAKSEMLNGYEKAYNERNTRKNQALAREYIRNFTRGESIPGIEWEYDFVKQVLPSLTLEMVNKVASDYVLPNPSIAISGPEKEGVHIPDEATVLAMLNEAENMDIAAPQEKVIDTELVKKAPKAGKVRKVKANADLGTVEWTLKNGVRVIFKKTDFKQDEIRMYAYSDGGSSLVETEDLPSCVLTPDIIAFMGLGDFSATDLQKALSGKTVSVEASMSSYSESVRGSSSVKDFESLMQLVYLTFTAPRRDEAAYQTLMNMLRNQLANKDKNHKAIFRDSVSVMLSNHSERTILLNSDLLDHVSLDKVMEIYRERFANPGDFTFLFVGNIDPADKQVRESICQWLGGLQTTKKRESYRDRNIRVPLGEQKNYFTRAMQIHTATNRIQYTSYDMPYTLANDLNMEVIGRVLDMRYLESVREREGGSYGVGTRGSMRLRPVPSAVLSMQFDTDPEKQERLMEIIHEEVNTIVNDGPRADDLQKAKESMLKDFAEDVEQNSWWLSALSEYYHYNINLLRDYPAAVEAITAETVQNTLRQLVSAGNVIEVVMMPE